MPHHDYDVLAAEVKRLSAALEASDRRVETREAEIKRLNEALVAAGKQIAEFEQVIVWADKADAESAAALEKANAQIAERDKRISELEARPCPVCGSATDGSAL